MKDADANYRTGTAEVTYDPDGTSPARIVDAFNGKSLYRAAIDTQRSGGQSKR